LKFERSFIEAFIKRIVQFTSPTIPGAHGGLLNLALLIKNKILGMLTLIIIALLPELPGQGLTLRNISKAHTKILILLLLIKERTGRILQNNTGGLLCFGCFVLGVTFSHHY
jgi:hypothetical protein